MLEADRDATLLRLFESFLEAAPQLLIQCYVLAADIENESQPFRHCAIVFNSEHVILLVFRLASASRCDAIIVVARMGACSSTSIASIGQV